MAAQIKSIISLTIFTSKKVRNFIVIIQLFDKVFISIRIQKINICARYHKRKRFIHFALLFYGKMMRYLYDSTGEISVTSFGTPLLLSITLILWKMIALQMASSVKPLSVFGGDRCKMTHDRWRFEFTGMDAFDVDYVARWMWNLSNGGHSVGVYCHWNANALHWTFKSESKVFFLFLELTAARNSCMQSSCIAIWPIDMLNWIIR